MTDAQFGILVTVIGAGLSIIGAAIRFVGNRVIVALDNNSAAMIANTKSNAVLATKIDGVSDFVTRTPAHGTPIIRAPLVGG